MRNAHSSVSPVQVQALPATGRARWHGALDGLHQTLVYGWAVDTEQPDARVVVEICFNGEAIGSFIADVARSDIADRIDGDVCHGFVADLGNLARKESGVLTARVANAGALLDGSILLDNPSAPPVAATSHVFSDGALRLYGWAVDARSASRPVNVHAYLGAKCVASTIANLRHPSIRSYISGANGFILDLPLALADGQPHDIRVVDDEGKPLNGSPVTICCHASGAAALVPAAEQAPLLAKVIEGYEAVLPRSLAFRHYPEWSSRFERPDLPAGAGSMSVAVIVTGEGKHETTLASLQEQQGIKGNAFLEHAPGHKPRAFTELLRLALESGADAIACIRAGDTLAPHALACAAEGLALPDAQIAYTDSESNDTPWLKPAWNPEYALATDYPLELMLVRASLAKSVFRKAADMATDAAAFAWHLLDSAWNQGDKSIVHVPRAVYRFNSPLTETERTARLAAAQAVLQAREPQSTLSPAQGTALPPDHTPRHLRRAAGERNTTVSLIIPTRDRKELLERCIDTIRRHTDWPQLEIIIVDNGSTEPATRDYLRTIAREGVRVLPMPGPFNFARLNNRAVEAATGDIIGLINNDIEALHDGWLDEILSHLSLPGVGAVGAKLLWPNGMVQHGGILLGIGNVAGHYGNALAEGDWGDHGRNQLTQQVSGVTAACLFMRKADYINAGGMDENAFPVAFNDVDLCLKLRAQGKTIIWTPHARLLHAESASRGQEDTPQKRARAQREIDQLRKRWGDVLLNDPAYHPSLNLDIHGQAFGGLALPPRKRTPRNGMLRQSDNKVPAAAKPARTAKAKAARTKK